MANLSLSSHTSSFQNQERKVSSILKLYFLSRDLTMLCLSTKSELSRALLSKENLEIEEKKEREEKESRISYKVTLERRTG